MCVYRVFRVYSGCIQGYVEDMSLDHIDIRVNIHHGYDWIDIHRLFP